MESIMFYSLETTNRKNICERVYDKMKKCLKDMSKLMWVHIASLIL